MKSMMTLFVLVLSLNAFAHNHEGEEMKGHDKEHKHVKVGKDHEHDEAHHKKHDHKAHHPEHKEKKVKKVKKMKKARKAS